MRGERIVTFILVSFVRFNSHELITTLAAPTFVGNVLEWIDLRRWSITRADVQFEVEAVSVT